jgi:hypothetical protein
MPSNNDEHFSEGGSKFHRRQFLHLAASTAAFTAMSRIAWAQAYYVAAGACDCWFRAGLTPDIIGRLIANGCRSGSNFHHR